MENKHYKIREDLSTVFRSRKLYRIEALKDLPQHDVKKGDIGGFVESYDNLNGNAWIGEDAKVYGNAMLHADACVSGNARVFGYACVSDNAKVYGNAKVCYNSRVYEDARVFGDAQVYGDACVYGTAWVCDNARVCGNARVFGNAMVCEHTRVFGNSLVLGNSWVACGDIKKRGDVKNIAGERYNITILPNHIQIGCQLHTKEEWWNFEDREILEMDGKGGLKWWKKWKQALMVISEIGE